MAMTHDEHALVEGAHWIKHPDEAHRDMWIRRVVIAIVAVIVIVGAFGLLGVRKGHLSQTTGSIRVDVTYPRVARPGLAVPFRMSVTGLDPATTHVIEVELSSGYADSFDFNNLTPDPESVARDREVITYEFLVEDSDELEMAFDTRVEPAVQSRRTADLSVTVDDRPVADLTFTTLIAP
jgi:hypothetical protein